MPASPELTVPAGEDRAALGRQAGLEPTAWSQTLYVPPWTPLLPLADGFEHLDRHDVLEESPRVPVVAQLETGPVRPAAAGGAFAGVFELALRQGDAGDPRAVFLRRHLG